MAFSFNAVLFAAVEVAKMSVNDMGVQAQSLGLCSVAEYVSAHDAYVKANAFTVSRSSLDATASKVKLKASASLVSLLSSVAEHNGSFPLSAPLSACLALNEDGSVVITLVSTSVPKTRSPRENGAGVGRMSADKIAKACSRSDGYAYSRSGESKKTGGDGVFSYFINAARVEGTLVQALFATTKANSKTQEMLLKYGYKPK
jgi:hypothetical protein